MPTIKVSTLDAANLFELNGLNYPKGVFQLYYDRYPTDDAGLPVYESVTIGLRNKYTNEALLEPCPATDFTDGTTSYADLDTLVTTLSTLLGSEQASAVSGLDPNGEVVFQTQGNYQENFSTNTPLAAGATFDSGIQDLLGFTQLWTEISSDVDGTLVGTWYDDAAGTNVVRTFTAPYVAADGLFFSTTVILGRYLRYVYTNGAAPQTRFHQRLKLDSTAYSGQFLKLDAFIPPNVLAAMTRSILVGQDTNNDYRNALVNSGQALVTGDFFTEVALGNINNYQISTKFGRNPDIDVGQTEDMWNGGGDYTGHPVSFTPETVDIASTSASDTSAGTGARTIRIFGLATEASTEYTSEDITMNGTTDVTSVGTWWRINRAIVLTAGSTGNNVGTISVTSSTGGDVFVQMPAEFNQTTIGAYTVPANQTMIIKRVRVAITRANGSAGSATITLRVRTPGTDGVYRAIRVFELQTGATTEYTAQGGDVIPAGSDVKFRIEDVSDNNTVAEGAFEYVLLNDTA